jgi:hypothetical protein
MFSGIKHTALTLHIGYTVEFSLFHIETLQVHVTTCVFQFEFQALVPPMF